MYKTLYFNMPSLSSLPFLPTGPSVREAYSLGAQTDTWPTVRSHATRRLTYPKPTSYSFLPRVRLISFCDLVFPS